MSIDDAEGRIVTTSEQIRSERRRIGHSQATLAAAAGVSERTVQNAEAGKPISGETLRALRAVLDIPEREIAPDPKLDGLVAELRRLHAVDEAGGPSTGFPRGMAGIVVCLIALIAHISGIGRDDMFGLLLPIVFAAGFAMMWTGFSLNERMTVRNRVELEECLASIEAHVEEGGVRRLDVAQATTLSTIMPPDMHRRLFRQRRVEVVP